MGKENNNITDRLLIALGFQLAGTIKTHDNKIGVIYLSPSFPPKIPEANMYSIYEVEGKFRHYFQKGLFNSIETIEDLTKHHEKYSDEQLCN